MPRQAAARTGSQEPRIRVEPAGAAYTDGPDAAALIAAYGFELDPWQRLVLDCWCARDASDAPLCTTMGLACPRQNGKNGAIEGFELYKTLVCGERILCCGGDRLLAMRPTGEGWPTRLSTMLTHRLRLPILGHFTVNRTTIDNHVRDGYIDHWESVI